MRSYMDNQGSLQKLAMAGSCYHPINRKDKARCPKAKVTWLKLESL